MTNVRGPVSNKCTYSVITTPDLWMVWFSYTDTLVVQQMNTVSMRYLLTIANCRKKKIKCCIIFLPIHGLIVFKVLKNNFYTPITFSDAVLLLVLVLFPYVLLPATEVCKVSV